MLLKFGSKEIRNIYDYTYALGEKKRGGAVTLIVKREGKYVPLEITFARVRTRAVDLRPAAVAASHSIE